MAIGNAKAVFADQMQLAIRALDPQLPLMIERDRDIAARKPGLVRKLLPLSAKEDGFFSGGCHLFDTMENARRYAEWCATTSEMGGPKFFERYVFVEPKSQFFEVIESEDFGDVATSQQLMRYERWYLPSCDRERLQNFWPKLRKEAIAAGNTTAWLLFDDADSFHPHVGLVTTTSSPAGELGKIGPAYKKLETQPSLGTVFETQWDATKVFDRTSWTYMIWFPETGNPEDETTLWPHGTHLPHLETVSA